ncbi:MAG: hypothetical protein Q9182_006701 [Xanthomendoza sp. 2 TL-2023]
MDSALVGHPPANDRDLAIIKGMLAANPKLAGKWPPERGSPPSPFWPPMAERNSDTKGGDIIASSVVVMIVVAFVTGTRLAARWGGKHTRIGWDDFFIIAAAVEFAPCRLSITSINIAEVANTSLGKRDYNHTYADLERFKATSYVSSMFLPLVQGFTKLSIVCFNARLTGLTSMTWRWIHRVLFGCSLVFLVFWTFFIAFLTIPVRSGYSLINAGRHGTRLIPHLNPLATTLAFTLNHVLLDWILLSIPTFIVFRLQMPLAKKLRCVVPLLIGALSCIGASYCAHILQHGAFYDTSCQYHPPFIPQRNSPSPTKPPLLSSDQYITILSWRHLDLTCAVLATSLPAIATLATTHLPPSWKKYYTSDRSTPKIYVGNHSNPLSSSKKLTSVATASQSATGRDRYDELVGHGGISVQHDIDLESLRGSEESGGEGKRGGRV